MKELLINLSAILLFPLLAYLKMVLHETGHLCGCLLAGWKPITMDLGTGQKKTVLKIGDFSMRMGVRIFSGMVTAVAVRRNWFRTQLFFWIACGPAVNAVLIFATLKALNWTESRRYLETYQSPLMMFLFWEILVTAYGLFPHMVAIDGRKVPNDGLQMWRTLRMSSKKADQTFAGHCGLLAQQFIRRGKLAEAEEAVRKAFGVAPNELNMKLAMMSLLLGQGRKDEALGMAAGVLNNISSTGNTRAEVLDSLACLPIYQGHLILLDHAMTWIDEALALEPETITLKGTKASLLIEKGELDAGMRMVEEVLAKSQANTDQAICKYYMALAYRKKGEVNKAYEWLREAQKIAPQCVVHERVEKEVARGAIEAGMR